MTLKALWSTLLVILATEACVSADRFADQDARHLSAKFADLMSGEFDSIKQAETDKTSDRPEDQKHGRVYRTFIQVDAPAVGETILVGTTKYNGFDGKPWYFDKTEFLVWTITPIDDGRRLIMSPRRFKDLEERIPDVRNAEKLVGFFPEDLEPAISGAACDIIWTPTDTGFLGRNEPCAVMSTTQNKKLWWHWRYRLEADALWVEFEGKNDDGVVEYATPSGRPYRLERIR